jgi:DNA-binding CsgD family transcriptional regulator/tetratricopeptide (TPR) repeat protein
MVGSHLCCYLSCMASGGQTVPLRGRDGEVADLVRVLDRAASGRLSIAVIEGEAGIGKSRLLAEVLDVGRARGMGVRAARALELERTRPFGVLVDALGCTPAAPDPRRQAIAQLLATRTSGAGRITVSSDAGLRFHAIDAFVDLVETSALERPLLLGLDDLQWADPSSLLTLGALARDLRQLPVAIMCCLRQESRVGEVPALMDAFEGEGARFLALDGLDDDALVALVRDSVAAEPGERLMAELAAANGNPLFVTELLAAIGQEHAIKLADGSAEVDEARGPRTLSLIVSRRLSNLSDAALDVLRTASILGVRFSVTDLTATTGRSVLALSSSLREAVRARVLEEDGQRLRFRHDLIRDAVYADIPEGVRLAMHREAGQRLADSGAPALQVAEHLKRSASAGDSLAVRWLTRAAREVATSSPLVAATLLQHAVELSGANDPERDGLLAERAVSLLWAGRLPEAEEACRDLLAREHDPAVEGPTQTCLVNLLLTQGRTAEALQQLEEVLGSSTLSDAERVSTWALIAIAHSSRGEVSRADAAVQKAEDLSHTVDDPVVRALVLCGLSMVCQMRAELSQALMFAEEAVRVADRSPDRLAHRYPFRITQARILLDLDRFSEARAALEAGRQVSQQIGADWMGPLLDTTLAVERFVVGEWDDALAEAETAQQLAREVDEGYIGALRLSVVALIAVHRGDVSGARKAMDMTGSARTDRGPRFRSAWVALAQARLLEAEGAAEEGVAVLVDRWDDCLGEGLAVMYPVIGPELVRLALLNARQSLAERVCAAVVTLAAIQDVPSFGGAAMRCRGLVERDPDLSLAAADAYLRAGRPLETALTQEESAALLSGGAAVSLLDQARDRFEQLGAIRDVARVDARLRALGVRRGRRGARRRPTSGWDSLTQTECTIVDLVAGGLSNRQVGERLFVSRRTVQTHLSHVFTKLDISSRTQLAAEAARRG